jgi:hypothetical protein
MLTGFYFRQTSRYLVISSSRVTLSTLPYPKSSETQAAPDGTPINYPTTQNLSKNDDIETKRLRNEQKILNVASNEKLAADTNAGLSKVSNTLVLPGVPVTSAPPPIAREQQQRTTKEEGDERIPSSRFSAFLRSIRSGLPFFPSTKNSASAMNIATTREHFIPV